MHSTSERKKVKPRYTGSRLTRKNKTTLHDKQKKRGIVIKGIKEWHKTKEKVMFLNEAQSLKDMLEIYFLTKKRCTKV